MANKRDRQRLVYSGVAVVALSDAWALFGIGNPVIREVLALGLMFAWLLKFRKLIFHNGK